MFILGITGGIGTGKSTVASICRAAGLPVIDADRIAHDITEIPGDTADRIAEALGRSVLGADGALDRRRVADLVFQDKRALDRLSVIVHEGVVSEIERRIRQEEKKKSKAVVLDVPIPVQHGFIDFCDQIWTVSADLDVRKSRLRQRGLDDPEIERRIRVQMSPDEYRAIGTHELWNNGSRIELERAVHALLKQEFGLRGIPLPGIPG